VYNEDTGKISAEGEYVLRSSGSDQGKRGMVSPTSQSLPLEYTGFDGRTIYLEDSLVLVPDGWIDFPFGDGHGTRRLYDSGSETGQILSY